MNKRSFLVSFIVFLFLVQEAFAYVSLRGVTYTVVNILDEVSRFICVLLGIPCYSFHTFLIGFLIPILLVYAMFFGILTAVNPFSGSSWNIKMYQIISLLLAAMMFLVANKYTNIFQWLITNGTGIVAIILYAGLFFLMILWGFRHFFVGGYKEYKLGMNEIKLLNDYGNQMKSLQNELDELTNRRLELQRKLTEAIKKGDNKKATEIGKDISAIEAQMGTLKGLLQGFFDARIKTSKELARDLASS